MFALCWSHEWCGKIGGYFLDSRFQTSAAYIKFDTQSAAVDYILEPKTLVRIAEAVRERKEAGKHRKLCIVNRSTGERVDVDSLLDEYTRDYYYECIDGNTVPSEDTAAKELRDWDRRFEGR